MSCWSVSEKGLGFWPITERAWGQLCHVQPADRRTMGKRKVEMMMLAGTYSR